MSSEIQLLSESVVQKIAAGEVIERPASVVKELVENSIDAGARRVTVEIAAGGQQLISVADDGKGMTRRDAELSTERHATSKIHSAGDLFGIDTLGFRGEALASIAAVSRLIIETRHRDDEAGTRLVIEGGVRRELTSAARDPGTTVRARSLFFNTPARRKFLRHIDTESRYITQALSQLAAAHPEVALQLKHQERQVLNLRPAERVDRAGELLGAAPDELLVSDWETSGLSIHVILCPPALCKRSRGKQFLIVRGRAIYSRALSSAVYAGYGGLLPHNAHPAYVLWLDLDPRQVDVNVHPTKREVRFADERGVGASVQHAVRQALNMPEVPAFTASPWPETKRAREPVAGEALGAFHTSPAGNPEADQLELSMLAPSTPSAMPLAEADSVIAEEAMAHLRASRSMWQLHNKYLLAPIPDGLALIDQHVAHERIRYEEIIDCLEAEGGSSQQLLLPVTFDVTPVEMDVFKEASALLEKLGFSIREFGPESLIVDGIPTELTNWGDGEILRQILSDFQEDVVEAGHEGREALAASMACHSSIRAGEALAGEEMITLVSRLLKTREPFNCPHGRPIILKIPLKEFDRLFGRT